MIAAVMAGGRATRFQNPVEKGVLRVGDRTLLERSLAALEGSGADEVIVVTTSQTPMTREYAASLGLSVFETLGKGYHYDVLELLDHFGNLLTLNVDVPFIRKEDVQYLQKGIRDKSIAAVLPVSNAMREPDPESTLVGPRGETMVWIGLNYVTFDPDVRFLILDEPLLSVNVNNESDLDFADALARMRGI